MAPEHLSEGGSVAPQPSSGKKKTQVQVQHDLRDEADLDSSPIDFSCYITEGAALATSAHVGEDGRIVLTLKEKTSLPKLPYEAPELVEEFATDDTRPLQVPALSVLITIVGSRGDVQPFIPIAHSLIKQGHRVRIGTHSKFKDFVLENNVEFYDIGGDPADLMSYMTKNPGLLPGISSLTNGDIPRKRKMIGEILEGCWKACYEPDPESGDLFAADVLISNPPCFAHIHCAEALNIPLHVIFTMPWCSTQAFPHPLVNVSSSNTEPGMTNYLSYTLVDLLSWQGLGDVINSFRKTTLGLKPLTLRSGPLILERLRIPTTFLWSPALIPKPKDWGEHIDVTGFTFLESGPDFQPPADLKEFLDAGDDPVYIGFGSVPVDDPKAMTQILFDAVKASGVRALISIGWGKLGDGLDVPDDVFLVGNVPHDWLFKRVQAAVHHGGAGTTAIAVKEGRPSLVVPFFGDQPFWGEMISKAGAGPDPIPHKQLTVENLTEALKFLVKPETLKAAQELGEKIRQEDGAKEGADSFHQHLPLLNMRCDVDPSRSACWWDPSGYLRLSPFAVQVLSDAGLLKVDNLVPHRVKTYSTRAEVEDPFSGATFAILKCITGYTSSFGQILVNPVRGVRQNVEAIPVGMLSTVGGIAEGTRNMPRLLGGRVRRTGEITGFKSGMKEAGKGLVMGIADGITGLVEEPIRGHQEEGGVGIVRGIVRGIGGLILKPAGGALGLVDLPGRGVAAEFHRKFGPQAERLSMLASTREYQGLVAVESSTPEQRQAVIGRWNVLIGETKERKKMIKREISAWERGMEQAGLAEVSGNVHEHLKRSKKEARLQAQLGTPLATPTHSDDESDDVESARKTKEQDFSNRYLNYERSASSSSADLPVYDHTHAEWPERTSSAKKGKDYDGV